MRSQKPPEAVSGVVKIKIFLGYTIFGVQDAPMVKVARIDAVTATCTPANTVLATGAMHIHSKVVCPSVTKVSDTLI